MVVLKVCFVSTHLHLHLRDGDTLWHSGSSRSPIDMSENSIWHCISILSHIFHVRMAWNRHSSAVGCCCLGCLGCGWSSWDGFPAATFGDRNSPDATSESFAHVLAAHPKVRHQLRQYSNAYAEHVPGFGGEFEFLDESSWNCLFLHLVSNLFLTTSACSLL